MKPSHASNELTGKPRFQASLFAVLSFALVWAIGLLEPSKAEATCGDYLSHHKIEIELASEFSIGTDSSNPQAPLRFPCHGPTCQRGPGELPASTPVVSIELQDHWVWFANSLLIAPNQASYVVYADEAVILAQTAFRLDRPPKA